MIRLAPVAVSLAILAALGYWVNGELKEKERLVIELQAVSQASESYIAAIAEMDKNQQKLEAVIAKREQRIRKQADTLSQVLVDFEQAKHDLSQKELECMDSAIPEPILDELRKPQGHHENRNQNSMSKRLVLHRNESARLQWLHLVRTGKVQQAVTVSHRNFERRQGRN